MEILDLKTINGMMKFLFPLQSEEIFNEYKEELQEFGDGLRKETEELVEITGHKVKDLPASLETGATVAQVIFFPLYSFQEYFLILSFEISFQNASFFFLKKGISGRSRANN